MSLHTLAHHLQEAGRGEDKVLVHMTPAEVGGLQSLAKAHGGSLTVNPQTGLPEAGFLSSILPMVAGFALGPAGVGLTAMQAGLATAAVGTAATGSLGKGLMMGLGAYGGAGLGAGLSSMGTVAPEAAVPQLNVATPAPGTTTPMGVEGMKQATQIFANPTYPVSAGNLGLPAIPAAGATPYAVPSPDMAIRSLTPNPATMPNFTPQGVYNPMGTPVQSAMYAPQPAVPTPSTAALTPVPPATPTPTASISDMTVTPSTAPMQSQWDKLKTGIGKLDSWEGLKTLSAEAEKAAPYSKIAGLGSTVLGNYYDQMDAQKKAAEDAANASKGMIRPYDFAYNPTNVASQPYTGSAERMHFNPVFTAKTPYEAPGPEYAAKGGIMGLAVGGPVEVMSAANAVGGNMAYPQSQLQTPDYSNPMMQRPVAGNVIAPTADAGVDAYSGEPRFAGGGLSDLGGYSDGGRLLKGPGDGVSDSIPAVIGGKQPARLADGEFVIPARIVSELGNGSTEAGAKRLYAMMDRVQKARGKTVGKDRVATDTNAEKHLPA